MREQGYRLFVLYSLSFFIFDICLLIMCPPKGGDTDDWQGMFDELIANHHDWHAIWLCFELFDLMPITL